MTTPTPTIRRATVADLDAIAALEAAAFLPTEAASREAYAARLAAFADRYWLLFLDGELVSLVGGMLTDTPDLDDGMFADASLHVPNGRIQMIFSVATHPDHQRRGYASRLLRRMIADCRAEARTERSPQGREAIVLTCKDFRIPFYASFGFVDEGMSASLHGGVPWHQMRLSL